MTVLLSFGLLLSTFQTYAQNNPNQGKPTLGVPVPELKLADDVKQYIREILAAPLPASYKLPSDIQSAKSYEDAVALVNKHYPQFVELENEDLLRAVKNNPVLYQEMMLEARSVREKYFPGSQPKIQK